MHFQKAYFRNMEKIILKSQLVNFLETSLTRIELKGQSQSLLKAVIIGIKEVIIMQAYRTKLLVIMPLW